MKKTFRTERRTDAKNSIFRLLFVVVAASAQVIWLIIIFTRLNSYSSQISVLTQAAVVVVALAVYGRHQNAGFKMPWIIVIMGVPIVGLVLYALMGRQRANHVMREEFARLDERIFPLLTQDETVLQVADAWDKGAGATASYLWRSAHYPMYTNSEVTFYGDTVEALEEQKRCLRQAKHFIFMEYYAIENKQAFGGILEILEQKVKEGVEVRLFYDDIGSIAFLSYHFRRQMKEKGINCRVFNPIVPTPRIFMNNRDHRKIMVVDGQVGFTGGYNLADEYFGITKPYGQWKDSGVRIIGEAVRSLTVMFLEMWNAIDRKHPDDPDMNKYLPAPAVPVPAKGFVQPYGDSPMDEEQTAENVYLSIISRASRYLYISTPYLVITDEMTRALTLAARRGVDVRIITPGIPDKKIVYAMTRSYYSQLTTHGVRIFEYTPGFNHAKQLVCDDRMAVCGTTNMDYRSFYLHFEDAVFFCGNEAVKDVKKDFDQMLAVSEEVTEKYSTGRSRRLRASQVVLRFFAPLT